MNKLNNIKKLPVTTSGSNEIYWCNQKKSLHIFFRSNTNPYVYKNINEKFISTLIELFNTEGASMGSYLMSEIKKHEHIIPSNELKKYEVEPQTLRKASMLEIKNY